MTDEAQPRPIEPDDTTVTPINGETKLSELASSSAAETDAYAAPVTTTRCIVDAIWIRAGTVVAAAAGIALAATSMAPSAIADDPFSLFMFNCGHVPTATPQLCKDTWDMVRNNKCRSTVVEYLDHRGVAFGDDRQMFNYATEIQRGDVPLDVC